MPLGIGASAAGPMGGRNGSYARAARAEYPARPYASCAPLPRYGYCSDGGLTAAFNGAPAEPAPLAPDVGVTGFDIGVLGFSSSFFAEGVDALLDVPDLSSQFFIRIYLFPETITISFLETVLKVVNLSSRCIQVY